MKFGLLSFENPCKSARQGKLKLHQNDTFKGKVKLNDFMGLLKKL